MDRYAKTIGNAHGGKDLAPIRSTLTHTVRSTLKSIALAVFAMAGWGRLRFTSKPTLIILTYHRVLPRNHPERQYEQPGMVVAPEALKAHIRFMKKCGAVPTHLDDWLQSQSSPSTLPRLSFALTFDDGWQDNFEYAYPILKEENVPATIFLVTQLLDTDRTFWPERVLRLLTTTAIPDNAPHLQWLMPFLPDQQASRRPLSLEDADAVINRLKTLDDATILAHLDETDSTDQLAHRNTRAILNRQELEEMASSRLVRYGAHTQHHYRLNRLSEPSDLRREIIDCLQDLKPLGHAVVPVFCYPNGDITGEGEALVARHYQAACTTKTGWNRATGNPFDLHRFNLHDGNSFSNHRLLASLGRGIL